MRQLDRSRDGPTSTPSATLLLARAQASSENLRIEKAPARVCRGSSLPERSVAGRYWRPVTAEAIVQPKGDQVHVLADPIVDESSADRIDDRERVIGIAHEQVVVFDTERPVRCEAVLKSNTDGPAPTGRAGRRQFNVVKRSEDAIAVAGHRRAAL